MPSSARVAPHIRERDARGLLHHVAQLPGQHQTTAPGHRRRLDEQHVAADASDRESGRHARHSRPDRRLVEDLCAPERIAHSSLSMTIGAG